MIRTHHLFLPVFLFFLALVSKLTWSAFDAQYLMAADPNATADLALVSGKFATALALAAALALAFVVRPSWRLVGPLSLILLAWAAASAVWSYDMNTTIFSLALVVCVVLYAPIAMRFLGYEGALKTIWAFGTVVILLSVALALIGDSHALMQGLHEGRWRGLFSHKNSFGPFVVIHLLLTVYGRKLLRLPFWLALGMIAVDVVALIGAQSAASFVAAFAGLIAGLYFVSFRNRTIQFVWRVSVVVIMVVAGVIAVSGFGWILEALGRDPTLSSRTLIWDRAIAFSFERPLGTGFGTGGGTELSLALQNMFRLTNSVSVQSGYLNLALELGWIAVALFVVWIGSLLYSTARRSNPGPRGVLLFVIVVQHAVISFTEVFGTINVSWSFIVLMLCLVGWRAQETGAAVRRPVTGRPARPRPVAQTS